MRFARIVLPLAATAGTLVFAMAPAAAQPYPAGSPHVRVSTATVAAGAAVVFSGRHFGAGDQIRIYVDPPGGPEAFVEAVHADAVGAFVASITLHGGGLETLVAIDRALGLRETAIVNVLRSGGALPTTGVNANVPVMAVAGLAAVVVGVLLVAGNLVRRRRAKAE